MPSARIVTQTNLPSIGINAFLALGHGIYFNLMILSEFHITSCIIPPHVWYLDICFESYAGHLEVRPSYFKYMYYACII